MNTHIKYIRSLALMLLATLVPITSCGEIALSPNAKQALSDKLGYKGVALNRNNTMDIEFSGLHAEGTTIVNEAGEQVHLKCVNIGGWLHRQAYLFGDGLFSLLVSPTEFEENLGRIIGKHAAKRYWSRWEDAFFNENDVKKIAQIGFNCVRIPFRYKDIIKNNVDGEIVFNDAGIQRIDDAISWGEKHHIYVIPNLAAAPGGQNALATVSDIPSTNTVPQLWTGPSAEENKRKTIALWKALAERYEDSIAIAGYDLINEPWLENYAPGEDLVTLYENIIEAIREVDNEHIVFIEGDELATDFSMFTEPMDDNLVYEFHAYSVEDLGHNDSPWQDPSNDSIQPYLDLAEAHDRPLWLGEFGENSPAWHESMITVLNEHQIGWAIWPWKRSPIRYFGIDQNHPVVGTLDLPASWTPVFKWMVMPWLNLKPNRYATLAAIEDVLTAVRIENVSFDNELIDSLLN